MLQFLSQHLSHLGHLAGMGVDHPAVLRFDPQPENQRLEPPSVTNVQGARNGSNDLTVTWDWRSRFGPFIAFGEPDFSEGATRDYDIELYDMPGGTLLRTPSRSPTPRP